MNTGEVKGFSMRKELPTGKRELGHPKERHKEKGGTTHEREREVFLSQWTGPSTGHRLEYIPHWHFKVVYFSSVFFSGMILCHKSV